MYLLFAALGLLVGTALPWAVILGRALWASPTAAAWCLWAGLMTLAGASIKPRRLALASAAVGGAVGVFFGVWQTATVFSLCGLTLGCVPGPGLGFVIAGGLGALYLVWRIVTAPEAA